MDVSDQLHSAGALPSLKVPLLPSEQVAGWAPDWVWMLWGREKSLASARNQTPIFPQKKS
jgi:hypothetical protein